MAVACDSIPSPTPSPLPTSLSNTPSLTNAPLSPIVSFTEHGAVYDDSGVEETALPNHASALSQVHAHHQSHVPSMGSSDLIAAQRPIDARLSSSTVVVEDSGCFDNDEQNGTQALLQQPTHANSSNLSESNGTTVHAPQAQVHENLSSSQRMTTILPSQAPMSQNTSATSSLDASTLQSLTDPSPTENGYGPMDWVLRINEMIYEYHHEVLARQAHEYRRHAREAHMHRDKKLVEKLKAIRVLKRTPSHGITKSRRTSLPSQVTGTSRFDVKR